MKGKQKSGIIIKSEAELAKMRIAGAIAAQVMKKLGELIREGVSTAELNTAAEAMIVSAGGKPAFKGYKGFPKAICVSVNEQVVHGIPGDRLLKAGDLVSIDLGVSLDGYIADIAYSFPVGEVSSEALKLLEATQRALYLGIAQARAGNRIGDISFAIQNFIEACGFNIIKELAGHGVGRYLHEAPEVPNFGAPGEGQILKPGMTLAIEPMVSIGDSGVYVGEDRWTVYTKDASLSAHFEHTIAITADGSAPSLLTEVS